MLFVRLHTVMGWLAGLFVLVLVGDTIVADESPFATIFSAAAWIIWAIFVVDFVTRLVLATSKKTFLKASWWQVVFLALPFLAMFRFLLAVRMARAGRLLSAAVRGTRSATANLRSRLATVAAVTVMIVLLAANVLYELGGIKPYSTALYAAALATIMGEPVAHGTAITQIMDVVLALYSVIVFATVAGSLGAFFLERSPDGRVAG
jgi:voltage-gated potassium channel